MTTTPTMEQETAVTFAERELADKGQELARMVLRRTTLKEAKDAENKKRQDAINELDDEIAEFAQSISDGFENRKQGDLFHDQAIASTGDALPKDKAAATLIDIAKRAERHPFMASETAIDTCAREACGAAAAAEVHVPPTPSEPHTFVPDGSGEGKCWACGSTEGDPVHAAPAVAEAPTEAAADLVTQTETHDGVTITYTAQAPRTVACSRCTKTTTKDEIRYDMGVKPVCDACVRAGIEAGTWPHEFRASSPKARRCADCHGRRDDAVHGDSAAVDDLAANMIGHAIVPTPEEEQAVAERQAASGDPAYDFPDDEAPPNVIRSHAAIEGPAPEAEGAEPPAEGEDEDDNTAGGEA
jgi:hypothetical protein